ncbi:hypothetical protein F0562_035190 [Nyssa sinensis]|uniref:Uncharacterized protein n=1 Tax=Nyssa sinensis TaxID=561372 RepID=A0A5J5AFD5_9ASTE|nr:hypothetical protein F0562_035190 [Nyssa sinensis]
MNSRHTSIRVLGQRSIPSTFFSRSSNRSSDCKEDEQNKLPNKDSRVSLSDFLNRKLHKSSVVPKSVQGKERPFLSPARNGNVNGSSEGRIGIEKSGEAEGKCVLDVVFEELKNTRKEKDCKASCVTGEVGSSNIDDMQESKKRRNPFQGGDEKQATRKLLVVLGDDPKPKLKRKEESFIRNKKPRPLYNHYANGSGWWDCNMEGVDSEEVGCSEVWEGIGSTALGGLEWH